MAAEATDVLDRIDSHSQNGVDAIFARWEVSISDTEMRHEVHQETIATKPTLQRELEEQEQQAALKKELDQLLAKKEDTGND